MEHPRRFDVAVVSYLHPNGHGNGCVPQLAIRDNRERKVMLVNWPYEDKKVTRRVARLVESWGFHQ